MTLADNINRKRKLAYASALTLAFAASPWAIGCSGGDETVTPVDDTGAPDTGVIDTGVDTGTDTGSDTGADTGEPDTFKPPTEFTATPTFEPAPGSYTSAQSVTIKSATPGAVIYYTTDGTKPNTSSPKYTSPINITKDTTFQAMAVAMGFLPSEIATAAYKIAIPIGMVSPIDFNPPTGTYDNDQTVSLTSATPAATICYTLDGSAPTCDETAAKCTGSSATYSASTPVLVNTTGRTIKALGCKVSMTTSTVTSATYTLTAAAAKFSPAAGTYDSPVTLTATLATAGATVRYTTDGTTPDCTTIGAPFVSGSMTISTNTTLKAITCKAGYNPSAVQTLDYKFRAAAPVIAPTGGDRNNETTVTMTDTTAGAIICYTTDVGKTPTCNTASPATCGVDSTLYSGAVKFDKDVTVRAVACSSGTVQSAQSSANYTFTAATPVITPANGTTWGFGAAINVSTTTVTTGTGATANNVNVYWTVDKPAPSCTTPPTGTACWPGATSTDTCTCGAGTASCNIPAGVKALMTAGSTVRAIACKTNYAASGVASATYPPAGTLPAPVITPNGGTFTNDTGTNLNPLSDADYTDANETPPLTITQSGPADANICYTISTSATVADPDCDATGACTTGALYNPAARPVVNQTGQIVKARTCKAGSTKSVVTTSASFTFNVAEPIDFNPTVGDQAYGTVVKITSATLGAEIHWVTYDAPVTFIWVGDPGITRPTCTTGTTGDYTVTATGNTWVVAIGCKAGYNPTSSDWRTYFRAAYLGAPVFTPGPVPTPVGDITNIPNVKITSASKSAAGFKMCYTTDGSTPGCDTAKNCTCNVTGCVVNSAVDGTSWTPTTSGQTINAIACSTSFANSAVSSATYNFRSSTPLFTPADTSWSNTTAYKAGAFVQWNNRTYKAVVDNTGVDPATDTTGATWASQSSLAVTIGLNPNDTEGGKTTGSKLCWRLNAAPVFQPVTTTTPDCTPDTTTGTQCNDGGAGVPADKVITITSTTTIFATSCRVGFTKSSASAVYRIAPTWHTLNMTNATNDFISGESFATTSASTGYMTWDANNVYLGFQGSEFTGSNYFHAYLNGDPADTTVTASPETGFGTAPLPFANANWHLRVKADGSDVGIKNAVAAGWGSSALTIGVCATSGSPTNCYQKGGAGSTSFIKVALSRASLGLNISGSNPDPMVRAVAAIWDGSANSSVFPAPAFTKYIEASLQDSRNPNDAAHIKP